jgi:hypothetical protein
MRGNLFVVTRVGQLRNVQTFIKEHDAANNHLAVFFTDANPVLFDSIEANVEAGLFEEVVRIRLPLRPVTQGRAKNAEIHDLIQDLLVRMASERGVVNLFLCNSDNFYVFFQQVIDTEGLTLTLNLLEEGLNTYANAGRRRYVRDTRVGWAEIRHRARHVRRSGLQAARSFASLLVTLISFVLRVDAVKFLKDMYATVTVSPKYRYGTITHYDNAYVYFPERIYSENMRIDHVEKLGFVLERQAPPELFDAIEDGAIVFVSQRYIPRHPYVYFSIVFDILTEMGVGTVYFKFHPREDQTAFAQAWYQAIKEHQRIVVLTTPEISKIPVEELMMAGKVKQVIGLTSTSLMYGKAFFPDVDVISIARRFRELADSDEYDVTKRALSEFTRDLEVFLDVSGVPQF